jgi:hypothetical protein
MSDATAAGDAFRRSAHGFLAQSPMGEGSHTVFSHVRYEERPLTGYRDGS